ncbi:cell envelope integrity protein CreD [Winogradskyella arenosi]|uniref:Inner membrane protein n=1 Tax=Winogradskyella arenosi TaxID=533325 RepID=A0A368ZKK1_9FLAO|nr:cell envelope integrity protein CreD [Winogradskyella arenosi]RCW92155.1 inner membrane protein [Winogradskyella arenosi]
MNHTDDQNNVPKAPHPQPNKFSQWLKTSITARMIMVGCLVLILLIPLSYVNSLISERSYRQDDVVNTINKKWGEDVLLYGPILKLPYKTYTETSTFNENTKTYLKETKTEINYAYIFPEKLHVNADVKSKTMYLGNFESAVFTSDMTLSGNYKPTDLKSKGIKNEDIIWNKSSIILKTSNLKGIKNEMAIEINGTAYPFETNFNNNRSQGHLDELETPFLNATFLEASFKFNMKVSYDGSEQIQVIPVGKTTTMAMASNWADPGFIGNYAPDDETRSLSASGFKVNWKVLSINRAFSQQYLNNIPNLNAFAFGTKFVVLVDEYQKSERAAKYGFLVIGLTFLIFFLIQTMSNIPIHAFQYLMIGLGLVMFYTLLVSISEHSNFLKAYVIAGISVIVLISLYSRSILKNSKFSALIGISLTALYTFIYVIIQLENYALLVGSVGLFIILAAVMFVSRKIDWHNN